MRRPALVAAAVAVGGVLALGLAAWIALETGAIAPLLRPVLEAKLGRRVSWAQLTVSHAPGGLRLRFTDLRVGQPQKFGPGDLARVPHADLVVRVAPLFAGRLEAPEVTLTAPELHLVRRGPGDNNYTFGKSGGASSLLGATRTLTITDGRVTMADLPLQLTLRAAFAHAAAGPLPLSVDGGGELKGEPFLAHARGGALKGRRPHAPYPLQVALEDGATRVDLAGRTQAPFDFRGLDMDVRATGPNLADLIYLFNLTAPNSPPYRLSGHMRRQDRRFALTDLRASVGDSDFAGEVTSEHLARRRIDARLSSRRLTAGDLRVLLASPPPHAVARATAGAPGRGGGTESKGRLFSTTPVSLRRLRGLDATLRYHADRADGFGRPLSDVRADLSVRAGRLAAAPLAFAVAGGAVRVDYTLDTAASSPPARLAARVSGLQLGRVAGHGFSGRVDLEADVRGTGASAAQQAASAQGRARVRVTAGVLPRRDAAALSGDLLGLVGGFLSPKGEAPLRCVAADFAISHGVADATRLVVATDRGRATGGGRIDLRDERLALRLEASSQGAAPPLQLRVPIVAEGPLTHPRVTGEAPPVASGLSDLVRSIKRLAGAGDRRPTPLPGC